MRILKTVHSLDPAAGGVATAVDSLSRAQIAQGHHVEIACFDDPASSWLQNRAYPVHGFPSMALRSYGWSPALAGWLKKNASHFDAVTVEGLWQYHGPAVRQAARAQNVPYFVYPHGMLDPWFQRAHRVKHLKKVVYWKLCEHRVLRNARAVAFTTEEERNLGENSFSPWSARSVISPLGVETPQTAAAVRLQQWRERLPALAKRRYLLFLGRIVKKKGVDLLLTAYDAVFPPEAREKNEAPALVLAGPESDAKFSAHCREVAATLGLREGMDIFWAGMLDHDARWAALEAADALVLPSHQENFGYVVAEALAVGTPVLISDKVNIWREIVADKAGVAGADNFEGTRQLLVAYAAWTPADRARHSAAARQCFAQRFQIDAAARRQIEVLSGAD